MDVKNYTKQQTYERLHRISEFARILKECGIIYISKRKIWFKEVWNKGLTQNTDERLKKWVENNSGEKSKHWKYGDQSVYHRKARKIMGVKGRNIVVHHIDGNYKNNSKDNLQVMELSKHTASHLKGKHNSVATEFKKGFHPKTQFKKGIIPWNKNHINGGIKTWKTKTECSQAHGIR